VWRTTPHRGLRAVWAGACDPLRYMSGFGPRDVGSRSIGVGSSSIVGFGWG
jgi:hypothetical protein